MTRKKSRWVFVQELSADVKRKGVNFMDINTEEIKKKFLEKTESVKKTVEEKAGRTLPWTKIAAALAGIVLVVVVAVNVVGGKTSSFLKKYEKIVVKAEKFAKKGDTKSFTALLNESEKLTKDIIEDMHIGNWSNRKKRKFEKLTERMYDAASKLDESSSSSLSLSKNSSSSKETTKQTLSPKKVPAYLKVKDYSNGTWVTGYNASIIPENLKIPDGIVGIVNYDFGGVFNGCTILESVKIPGSVETIGDWAFRNCTSLASVTLAKGVKTIGKSAFFGCTSLASVTLAKGVKTIEYSAFGGCTSLASIAIPEGVSKIGDWAFQDCTALKSITIPEGGVEIGVRAFENCTALESVTIAKDVPKIDGMAFGGCTSLKEVRYKNTVKRFKVIAHSHAFGKGVVIHCTDGDYVIGSDAE